MSKTVCFTGHRPHLLGGYDESNPIAIYVKEQLSEEIKIAINDGYTRFIFGGALGVDTWAGEIVADYALFYDAIILDLFAPFEGQEVKWNIDSQLRYFNLMARCNNVFYVSEPGYQPWKMLTRDKAMVDAADLVIACWNGDVASGTGHTVDYARKKKKDMIIIDPRHYNVKAALQ